MAMFELDLLVTDLERRLSVEKSLKRRILLENAIRDLRDFDRLTKEN